MSIPITILIELETARLASESLSISSRSILLSLTYMNALTKHFLFNLVTALYEQNRRPLLVLLQNSDLSARYH